jgi:plastocyanin
MTFAQVRRLALPAGLAALVTLAPAVAGAGAAKPRKPKPVTKKVKIFDNYYEPAKLTVPRGSTIVWQWPITTGDAHDVTLDKGPKGVRKFQSQVAASDYTFKRKLTKKGRYHIICTLHEEMTMDITVR